MVVPRSDRLAADPELVVSWRTLTSRASNGDPHGVASPAPDPSGSGYWNQGLWAPGNHPDRGSVSWR